MEKEVLVSLVVIIILFFIAAIVMIVFSLGITARDNVAKAAESMQLGENELFAGQFDIADVHFFNRSLAEGNYDSANPCAVDKEIIIAKVVFKNERLPDFCDMLLDGRIVKRLDIRKLACKPDCTGKEIYLAIDLPKADVTKEHQVELCCDQLCLKQSLSPLCG
jgi:hypothetical protein